MSLKKRVHAKKVPQLAGIAIKKKFGQHFLRDDLVANEIVDYIDLDDASVFEIGCGDGSLTRIILQSRLARLWVFEIDPEWANYVQNHLPDLRMQVFTDDILDIDFSRFAEHTPWVLLSNLPYQITFPLLYKLQKNRQYLREGVIMVQEEVAQKIVATHGRPYGFNSLFFQHYFEWKLLRKIPPSAFYPPPKVFSRLLYFKPKKELTFIPEEEKFWKFIKVCFKQPRRTLRNNLQQYHADLSHISDEILALRAQQMSMHELLEVWNMVRTGSDVS